MSSSLDSTGETTFVCTKCAEPKVSSEFYRDSRRSNGLQSQCKACYKVYWDRYRKENREKLADWQRDYRRNSPRRTKDTELRSTYGITLEDYHRLATHQGFVCGICGEEESNGRALSVDHCHETGEVRGLLCSNCNTALGLFKDSPGNLEAAMEYLR